MNNGLTQLQTAADSRRFNLHCPCTCSELDPLAIYWVEKRSKVKYGYSTVKVIFEKNDFAHCYAAWHYCSLSCSLNSILPLPFFPSPYFLLYLSYPCAPFILSPSFPSLLLPAYSPFFFFYGFSFCFYLRKQRTDFSSKL